jgi:hypothetical protein
MNLTSPAFVASYERSPLRLFLTSPFVLENLS